MDSRLRSMRIIIPLAVAVLILAGLAMARADEADDQYAVAAGNYDRQQWKLAVAEFQAFLQKYPNDRRAGECEYYLAEALLQLGQLDSAREHFRRYAGREPKGKYAQAAAFRAGEAAYLAGKFAAAKPELAGFLTKYPDDHLNAYVLPYLGEIVLAGGDAKAAVGYFSDGLKRFPDGRMQDDCRYGLGRALEKLNQLEEAERLYLAVAGKTSNPLADAAQLHLGALQYTAGRYDRAVESFSVFEDRLASSAWRPNARLGRGLALLKLNRPAEAIKQFDAVAATPAVGEELLQQALRGIIQAALQMKDYATLDVQSAQFEKKFPAGALGGDVRRMLARSLVERKQFARAAALLEPMVKSSPLPNKAETAQQDVENRYLLAVCHEGLKRYPEALAVVLPAVEAAKGPLKADAQLLQGSVLAAMKKYAEAVAPLEAALQEKPSDEAVVKAAGELAICHARCGRLEKAKQIYAELLGKHPRHPLIAPTTELLAEAAYDANDAAWSAELSGRLAAAGNAAAYELKGKLGLGWSLFKEGKLTAAAAAFDEVLKKSPPAEMAAEAALVRGRILEQLGQNEPALTMYALAIEKYPADKQRAEALLFAARLRDKLKQYPEAAALYQRLAKDFPQFSKLDAVLYEWAWALRELKQPEEADRLFDRLRKEHPQSRYWADVTCRLAQQALAVKNFDKAAAMIDELLTKKSATDGRNEPADPKIREFALFLRGQAAAAKADWPKLRESFTVLLTEFPDTKRRQAAEFWIAESHYRQGDYTTASPLLEKLSQKISGPSEPWMAMIPLRRAQILAQQNRWNEAYPLAVKIAADFPRFEQQYEVDYLLGRCLAKQADFEGARHAYLQVIRSPGGAKTETAAMAQWMIGETHFHQKNYEAALREYLRVDFLYAYPTWQAGALLQAGKCRELLGEAKEAADIYQRLLKNYPKTTFVEEAAQRLKNLEKPTQKKSPSS